MESDHRALPLGRMLGFLPTLGLFHFLALLSVESRPCLGGGAPLRRDVRTGLLFLYLKPYPSLVPSAERNIGGLGAYLRAETLHREGLLHTFILTFFLALERIPFARLPLLFDHFTLRTKPKNRGVIQLTSADLRSVIFGLVNALLRRLIIIRVR